MTKQLHIVVISSKSLLSLDEVGHTHEARRRVIVVADIGGVVVDEDGSSSSGKTVRTLMTYLLKKILHSLWLTPVLCT